MLLAVKQTISSFCPLPIPSSLQMWRQFICSSHPEITESIRWSCLPTRCPSSTTSSALFWSTFATFEKMTWGSWVPVIDRCLVMWFATKLSTKIWQSQPTWTCFIVLLCPAHNITIAAVFQTQGFTAKQMTSVVLHSHTTAHPAVVYPVDWGPLIVGHRLTANERRVKSNAYWI